MKTIYTVLIFFSISVSAQKYENVLKKYSNFNGAILVAEKGKIVFLKGTGMANHQENILINTKTKFRICSITKTFTAALILQLYEKGKLNLTDKIGKYLPDYQGEGRDKVTIHQLLTYSSGIENLDQNNEEMYAMKFSVDSLLKKYCSGKLVNNPGERFNYKNVDFIILGKIIEAITQKSFETVLKEEILDKYGMRNSGMLANSKIIKGLANNYLYNEKSKTFENDDPYWIENFYAAGAMYSTVEDLLKFDQALFTNKILTAATMKIMLKPNPELYSVAYGFWVSENTIGGKKVLAADRQGSISGSNTSWLHLINDNKTYIIFSNNDATNLNNLRAELAEISTFDK